MSARMLAASAIVVLCAFGASPVSAADIYDDDSAPQAESPYSDPRYGDIYGTPKPPRYAAPAPQSYQPPPYSPPRSPQYAPGAKDDGYDPRAYSGPRYTDRAADRYAELGPACIPRRAVRQRLASEGWGDFHDLEIRDRIALLRARRSDGRLYELKIDRCSGEVVRARPSNEHRETFAFRQRFDDRRY